MKIVDYLPSLVNGFNRERVQTNITYEREDLTTRVIPQYAAILRSFPMKEAKFKNVVFNDIYRQLKRQSTARGELGVVEYYLAVFKQLERSSAFINEAVDEYFRGKDILRDGLTYATTTLLQYAEMLSFINRYALRLADNVLAYEMCYNGKGNMEPSRVTVNNQKWLLARQKDFIKCMHIASLPEANLKKKIEGIPQKVISQSNVALDAQSAGNGMATLDPLGFGFITGRMSPLFQAQLQLLRYQNARNQDRKRTLENIEQRLLYLREERQGRISPKQQELIRYLEKKQRETQRKVEEWEGDM